MTKVEWWGAIRKTHGGSYFITIPSAVAQVLIKSQNSPIVGEALHIEAVL